MRLLRQLATDTWTQVGVVAVLLGASLYVAAVLTWGA